jgi:hypothetical protein
VINDRYKKKNELDGDIPEEAAAELATSAKKAEK